MPDTYANRAKPASASSDNALHIAPPDPKMHGACSKRHQKILPFGLGKHRLQAELSQVAQKRKSKSNQNCTRRIVRNIPCAHDTNLFLSQRYKREKEFDKA